MFQNAHVKYLFKDKTEDSSGHSTLKDIHIPYNTLEYNVTVTEDIYKNPSSAYCEINYGGAKLSALVIKY